MTTNTPDLVFPNRNATAGHNYSFEKEFVIETTSTGSRNNQGSNHTLQQYVLQYF